MGERMLRPASVFGAGFGRIIAAVVLLWLASTEAQSQDTSRAFLATPTIRFCYQDTELFPNYIGEGASKPATAPGVNIELYDLVAAEVGASVAYMRYSWNRCLALLTAGRVDSVIASYTEERARIADYPMANGLPDSNKRITTSGYYLYHRGSEPFWDGSRFLKSAITVGAPMGYSIVEDLSQRDVKVLEAGTTASLLTLLRYGRIDAIAVPGSTTDALIRNDVTQFAMIVKDPVPLRQSAYYIAFSKTFAEEEAALVHAIWDALPAVRTENRERILATY